MTTTLSLEAQEIVDKVKPTDFCKVAMAALDRGFAVTPLRDKHPFLHGWNKNPLTTESEIRSIAKDYPHNECGVVLRREVDKPFVIDIDKECVLERMPPLPPTYTVLTRPESETYKRHIFFLHTEYSDRMFGRNVFAGDFDLIGVGKAALQVVAEGCVRDTGEIRTGNDLSIVPVPDEIVDWLIAESKRLAKEKTKKRHNQQHVDDAFPTDKVPRGRRSYWLKWLAKWLVSFRLRRKDVLAEITRQCQLHCEDGVTYCAGTGKKRLRAIAYDRSFKPSDPLKWMKRTVSGNVIPDLRNVVTPLQRRRLALTSMQKMISPADAQNALGLVSRKNLSRDMKAGGYAYDAARNLWIRGAQ